METLIDNTPQYSSGTLKVQVTSILNARPIVDATIRISITGAPEDEFYETQTNMVGQTEDIVLPTPSGELSQEPSAEMPYAEYNLQISAPSFETIEIVGVNVLANTLSIQNIVMVPIQQEISPTASVYIFSAYCF